MGIRGAAAEDTDDLEPWFWLLERSSEVALLCLGRRRLTSGVFLPVPMVKDEMYFWSVKGESPCVDKRQKIGDPD